MEQIVYILVFGVIAELIFIGLLFSQLINHERDIKKLKKILDLMEYIIDKKEKK